eukprot:CAMPEP_0119260354 /NCGR_PEP_ID=MMETSP1329-20130426/778_1 /TAXON_ID=114041 /ORGANISM="Genus nov. species nov., Strain RCC1024" /LENGTH=193 /DNA_ID=CAMNT_0007259777 /DNA_START=132 /DNA_END=713 /DNA_ORIENTATION=+
MSLMARISAFPKAQPFAFNLGVAAAKTSAADLMTQTVVEKRGPSEIDWKRNGSFCLFGFAYLGGFQYWMQVNVMRRIFSGVDKVAEMPMMEKLRDPAALAIIGKQVAFDIFVHMPFMYFPAFYMTKEVVQGTGVPTNGLTHYVDNFSVDQVKMASVWGPADLVLFSGPMWLRLPLRHVVSFGWTAYVSFLRGA